MEMTSCLRLNSVYVAVSSSVKTPRISPLGSRPSTPAILGPKAYGATFTIMKYGMSDNDTLSPADAQCGESPDSDAIATMEAYETEEGVVLYDATNPLAWLHANTAISLDDAV